MKRILVLLMTCLLAFTTVFGSACSKKEEVEDFQERQSLFNDGIHIKNYTETDNYLIKDGKTDYKLLVTRERSKYINRLVEDFKELFYEATGIEIPVVYDDEVYFDNNSKFISLGKNAIFNQTGLVTDEYDLDKHGYIIKTFYKSIFIAGDYDRGTMFGAYEFLETEFNFETYSNLVYVIDENVTDLKLKNYDVTDVPDIKNRAAMNSFIINYQTTQDRMRMVGRDEETFLGSASAHTYEYYLPKAEYSEAHPEWYGADKTQLCLTAHGDPESRALMIDTLVEKFKYEFMNNEEGYILFFGSEDHGNWCACKACSEIKAKYNQSNAAVVIHMCNELAARIDEWMKTEEGKPYAREFFIMFTAYQHTERPPVNYDVETKTYSPIDETVVCRPDVSVDFAPGNLDYQNSLFHEINTPFLNNFDAWSSIVDNFNIYKYCINYNYTLMPYDTFSTQQEFLQYAASKNTYWLFDEGNRYVVDAAAGWQMLKNFISSELEWNVNADVGAMIDEWFDNVYGDGGVYMRRFFDEYRAHSRNLIENYDFTRTNSLYHSCLNSKYWSKQLLDRWEGYINQALESIEYLKQVDMAKYLMYYDTIAVERITVYYMMVKLYGNSGRYSQSYIKEISALFNEDCQRLGVTTELL